MRQLAKRTVLVVSILSTIPPTAAARAQDVASEVLAQARDAIGVKPALALTSLAVTATVRRSGSAMPMEISSDVELECLLPGRYRRTESISFGGMTREVTLGMNGDALFYDDGGAAAAMGIDPTEGDRGIEARKGLRLDLARLLTIWLLTPPDNQTFTLNSAGVAEAPDGKADVLDVTGPDNFNLRLFFDTTSHRLLMATYEVNTVALDKQQMQAMQEAARKKAQENPKDSASLMREMQDAVAKLPKKKVTMSMHPSDFRAVSGLTLPHQMTVGPEKPGNEIQTQETWTISSFKVNPSLKPERFEKKKK